MASCAKRGKHFGDDFERLLAHQAAVSGMLLVVHGLQARYVGRGRIVGVKSDLDMRLHYQGRTAIFDAKSRGGKTLALSGLDIRQRQLAQRYASAPGLISGFLVQYRGVADQPVVFHPADTITRLGCRGSLSPGDGVLLGSSRHFALSLMFA